MEDTRLDRLHPGLPVSDVRGDRIGTVAQVYRLGADATSGPTASR